MKTTKIQRFSVGAPLPHSNLWEACWRYVMQYMATAQDEGTAPSSDDAAPYNKGSALTVPSPDGASQNRNTASSPANTAFHEEDAPGSQAAPPRHHNRYLRSELADQMVRLYRAGHSAADIAQMFGFHRQTVARHLKRAGLSLRTNTSDPVFRLRVQQTYQTIGTIKGTARQLGVSPGAVRVVVQGG